MKIALVLIILVLLSSGMILIICNYRPIDGEQLKSSQADKGNSITIPRGNVQSGERSLMGSIIINTTVPEGPSFLPVYRQHYREGDQFSKNFGSNRKPKQNVTSEEDAPEVAKKVMEQFGGLPPDAQYTGSHTEYLESQTRSGELIRKEPILTNVYYRKLINGMPVSGDIDQINLELGENGELLNIYKSWSTLIYVGDVPIISPNEAVEKLQQGDTMSVWNLNIDDVYINNITPGYREYGTDGSITEPIWFFIGKTGSGNIAVFEVYARQFANFTAMPMYGTAPLTVTFTDTSNTSPIKWHWVFGDGTTSTIQNPVHTYTTAASYNVSLRAWNDLGSDTMVKTSYILIGKKAIVMHIDTKLDELMKTQNAMNIPNGNKNSLKQKLENAQSKNGDALKFIDQNKEPQANNMLNAEDNMMNAFMNEVDAQSGKTVSTVDAAKLKDGATEITEFVQKAIETPI
jgi:hypothetical protein